MEDGFIGLMISEVQYSLCTVDSEPTVRYSIMAVGEALSPQGRKKKVGDGGRAGNQKALGKNTLFL